jgi:hypothetical protein
MDQNGCQNSCTTCLIARWGTIVCGLAVLGWLVIEML